MVGAGRAKKQEGEGEEVERLYWLFGVEYLIVRSRTGRREGRSRDSV